MGRDWDSFKFLGEKVEALLEDGAVVDAVDALGRSALHIAGLRGEPAIAEALVKAREWGCLLFGGVKRRT